MKRISKELSELPVEEQAEQAYAKLLQSVTLREQSTLGISRKLRKAGFSEAAIQMSVERAVNARAIDDNRYCECLARTTIASGKGVDSILGQIADLGIDPHDLEALSEYFERGEDLEYERAMSFMESHPPKSKNPYPSIVRKLVSRGYAVNIAKRVAGDIVSRLDDRH